MSRPPLEVADLIRAAGTAFLERNRQWIRSRSVHPLRTSRHLLQLLPQSPLSEVSDRGPRTVDRRAAKGTSPDTLCPCGLHAPCAASTLGAAEQETPLWPAASRQRGNASRSRSRPATPRRGNWFLQCAAYLESETHPASPCALRYSCRWTESRSHPLGEITKPLLSPPQSTVESFSRQVRRWPQASLPERPTAFPWKPGPARPAENFRCLVTLAVPKRLGCLRETPLRWPRICASVSGPLHPSHRLVSFTEGKVTFRWRDSAHHNEQKLITLSLDEFLRRFLLHLLPKGFVHIRNFGFLANRRRATLLPLCFQLLGAAAQQPQADHDASGSNDLWRCPVCGGPMVVVERLSAAEIQLRSPPTLVTEAA